MITRELVKEKIDNVQDEYLDILYRIVQSFESKWTLKPLSGHASGISETEDESWHRFVALTYGSTTTAPLKRWEQGNFEVREVLE